LGTGRSGWYKNDLGATVDLGADKAAFTEAIDTLFERMGDGDIYTVTVKLTPTGGNAAETTFTIQRQRLF